MFSTFSKLFFVAMKKVLLTGPPGIGKTTLVKHLAESLSKSGRTVCGFYTNEVRESGSRIGFDVVSIPSQESRPLARESSHVKGPKVGKYSVLLSDFEAIALPCLNNIQPGHVVFIDEIGAFSRKKK